MGETIARVLIPIAVMACGSSGTAPDAAAVAPPVVVPGPAVPVPAALPPGTPAKAAPAAGERPVVQVRFDRIEARAADKPLVRRGVRPHVREVRACYERGLARAPGLHGQVEVAIAIRKGGRVARARVASSNLADRQTASCVARAARHWSFRGATKRVDAVVRFKFYRG